MGNGIDHLLMEALDKRGNLLWGSWKLLLSKLVAGGRNVDSALM